MMIEGLNFVLGVNLIIWAGISFYLLALDLKIKKLVKGLSEEEK